MLCKGGGEGRNKDNDIRSDFEKTDVCVDQYIDKIESECKICRCKLWINGRKNMTSKDVVPH